MFGSGGLGKVTSVSESVLKVPPFVSLEGAGDLRGAFEIRGLFGGLDLLSCETFELLRLKRPIILVVV